MSRSRAVKSAVAVILLWSGLAVAQTPSNEPIKIGWIGHLTGILSAYGQDMLRAAEMAVSDINASGGVLGRKLQLVVRDDRGRSFAGCYARTGARHSGARVGRVGKHVGRRLEGASRIRRNESRTLHFGEFG